MFFSSICNNSKKINFIFQEILRITEQLTFQITALTVISEAKENFSADMKLDLTLQLWEVKAGPAKSSDQEEVKKPHISFSSRTTNCKQINKWTNINGQCETYISTVFTWNNRNAALPSSAKHLCCPQK